jgi:hypothetical protein
MLFLCLEKRNQRQRCLEEIWTQGLSKFPSSQLVTTGWYPLVLQSFLHNCACFIKPSRKNTQDTCFLTHILILPGLSVLGIELKACLVHKQSTTWAMPLVLTLDFSRKTLLCHKKFIKALRLTPIIPATQEAYIGGSVDWGGPWAKITRLYLRYN